MELNVNANVFIHCVANQRVSTFMYLYRRIYAGISDEEAKQDLHEIWIPNQVWQRFIDNVMNAYR